MEQFIQQIAVLVLKIPPKAQFNVDSLITRINDWKQEVQSLRESNISLNKMQERLTRVVDGVNANLNTEELISKIEMDYSLQERINKLINVGDIYIYIDSKGDIGCGE